MVNKNRSSKVNQKGSVKRGNLNIKTKKATGNKIKNNKPKKPNSSNDRMDTSDLVLSLGTKAPIDSIDADLIQILLKNGRLSNVEIANMLKTSEATIRRRIQTLKERGFIRGFSALLDYKRFGHVIMAHIFIQVKKKSLEEIAETLAKMENTCTVYRVIGDYNISSVMVFKNIAELQEFLDRFSDSEEIDKLNYLLATASYKSCQLTGI
jgi:DNA-binding Lrp family transcriptional regulator